MVLRLRASPRCAGGPYFARDWLQHRTPPLNFQGAVTWNQDGLYLCRTGAGENRGSIAEAAKTMPSSLGYAHAQIPAMTTAVGLN